MVCESRVTGPVACEAPQGQFTSPPGAPGVLLLLRQGAGWGYAGQASACPFLTCAVSIESAWQAQLAWGG